MKKSILMNLSLKVKRISLIVLISMLGCKKEDNFSAENLYNLKIMDPNDTYSIIEPVNDTIYYFFQPNGEMIKIGYDYSIKSGTIKLVSVDTIKCVYILDKDILYMKLALSEYNKLLPSFGKDECQWEILKLNSDTMIVNLYAQKKKVGHCGFKVLK